MQTLLTILGRLRDPRATDVPPTTCDRRAHWLCLALAVILLGLLVVDYVGNLDQPTTNIARAAQPPGHAE